MPHACTFTTTSSGPASGSGTSSTSMLSMPLKTAALTARSSRFSGGAGRQALTQHLLVDLPGCRLGELIYHVPARGHLERSEPLPAVLFHLGQIRRLRQHEHGMDLLSANLVGTPDDGGGLDACVLEQHVFDLARVHVLAAADDHVLLAVDEVVVAVLVDVADVARVQPPAAKRLGGRLRIAEVAHHDVSPAEADLAELARRNLVVAGVEHRDVLAPNRPADRPDLPRAP